MHCKNINVSANGSFVSIHSEEGGKIKQEESVTETNLTRTGKGEKRSSCPAPKIHFFPTTITAKTQNRNQTKWQPTPKPHQSTSKPLLATIRSGMDSVCRGSTIPSVGLMALEAIPAAGKRERAPRGSEQNRTKQAHGSKHNNTDSKL